MKPRPDTAYRAQATPQVLALLMAYESATNRSITLSYMRMHALSEIARRDYTPDDIVMVVRYVRRRIANKPKSHGKSHGMSHGFSDASIGFQNLLLDVDKFEDRVLEAREDILKRATAGRGGKAVRLAVQAGPVTTMIETEQVRQAAPVRAVLAEALAALAKEVAA